MTEILIIESGRKLPTQEDIFAILKTHERLEIHYEYLPSRYVFDLTYYLPDKSVYDRKWDKKIFISPSIHNDQILNKKFELLECAKAFRHDANLLMGQMAKNVQN